MVTTRPAARHLWVKTVRAFKFARAYKNEMVHLLASEHIDGMYRKYLAYMLIITLHVLVFGTPEEENPY